MINFKMNEVGEVRLTLDEPETWEKLLSRCVVAKQINPRGLIAVRSGRILLPHDKVTDGDVLEVFPAISGG